jgi:hypothetical protein
VVTARNTTAAERLPVVTLSRDGSRGECHD